MMSRADDFHLLCTVAGFGSNWYSLAGLLLDIAGFFTLWLSAEHKLTLSETAETHRRLAIATGDRADQIEWQAGRKMAELQSKAPRVSQIRQQRDIENFQRSFERASAELHRESGRARDSLRRSAGLAAQRGDELSILGLNVERRALNLSAMLILAGFVLQVAGSFPGCQ
ncbi:MULTISPECIES: hypothetical protein [Mesorhizobium]|uniref:hypothetical protein n=1 Tax=Mesorhizobium australicum TaxID=536018 RepID=UPI0033366B36